MVDKLKLTKKLLLTFFILLSLSNINSYGKSNNFKIKIGSNYKKLTIKKNISALKSLKNNITIIKNFLPTEGSVIYPNNSKLLTVYEDNMGKIYIPTGTIIIELNNNLSKKIINKWMTNNKLTIIKKISIYRNQYIVKYSDNINIFSKVEILSKDSKVIHCSPNILTTISKK